MNTTATATTTRFAVTVPSDLNFGQGQDLTLDCIEYEGYAGFRMARPAVNNCSGMKFFQLDGYSIAADNEREAAYIAAALASMQVPTHY